MRVIGTVGMPGSGKGEAAAVAEELDIPVVTMGDVIRRACRDQGLDPAQHHGQVAQSLREEHGLAAVAERSLPVVEARLESADTVLVDGIRSDVEAAEFRRAFGDTFTLVAVHAPLDVRRERVERRGRPGDSDGEDIEARDERELGFGMGDAIDEADVTITNAGSLSAFHDRVADVLTGNDTPGADS